MASSPSTASILTRLQTILESQLSWSELTSQQQQQLFDLFIFNLTLNTFSPQETYQLLQASPDLLTLFSDPDLTPSPSTTQSLPSSTVPEAIITANLIEDLQLDSQSNPKLAPQNTADWVQLALKNHQRNQDIINRLRPQQQLKQTLQQNIIQSTPKSNQPLPQTQQTLETLITSTTNSLNTSLTPTQKKQALQISQNLLLTSSLQQQSLPPLVATTTAINLVSFQPNSDPVKIARQVDRLQSPIQQTPHLIDKIENSQQEINQFVHKISTQPSTINIINQLHTQITPQTINQVSHLYHHTLPSSQQKTFSPFPTQAAQEIATAVELTDPTTATIIRAYNQGLTPQDVDQIINQPTARLTPEQHHQLLLTKSQLIRVQQSTSLPDIKPQTLSQTKNFLSRLPFSKLLNRFSSTPLTRTINTILHPRLATQSWLGRRIGKRLAISFYKKFTQQITNKTARFAVKSVLRQGLRKGLQTTISALTKKGATLAAEAALTTSEAAAASTGIGVIIPIVIEGIKFVAKGIKKTFQSLQSVSVSLWGQKLKARDLVAAPIVFVGTIFAGFTSAISFTASAMASAATSVGLTIAISSAIAGLLYLTAFTAAPLISTIAQLESTSFSGISSSCANTEGIFIYQGNPAWSGTFCSQCSTSGTCNIGGSGCGSASMTMILNAFGANTGVKEVWHQQHSLGGYAYTTTTPPYTGCGTDNSDSLKILTQAGLSVSEIVPGEMDSVLEDCGLILATGQVAYKGEWYGHLIVIIGHNGNQITTLDPGRSDGDHFVHTLGQTYKITRTWSVVP